MCKPSCRKTELRKPRWKQEPVQVSTRPKDKIFWIKWRITPFQIWALKDTLNSENPLKRWLLCAPSTTSKFKAGTTTASWIEKKRSNKRHTSLQRILTTACKELERGIAWSMTSLAWTIRKTFPRFSERWGSVEKVFTFLTQLSRPLFSLRPFFTKERIAYPYCRKFWRVCS